MTYAKTLSLVAALALIGCAQSTKPATTTTESEQPAAGGDAAAATETTTVLKVEGMT